MQVNNAIAQNLPPTAQSTGATSENPGSVGKETFLRLLITQLEHQDPLSPMQNAEFTAQLAQFNTLEQTATMNENLKALLAAQEAVNGLQAAGLIGKEVKAQGNNIELQKGEASPLNFTLAKYSAAVSISIFDDSGELVRKIDQPAQAAGAHSVPWDGKDSVGRALPDGGYHFAVAAQDDAGNTVQADTFLQGIVEGVAYVDARPFLLVGGSQVELTSLTSVKQQP